MPAVLIPPFPAVWKQPRQATPSSTVCSDGLQEHQPPLPAGLMGLTQRLRPGSWPAAARSEDGTGWGSVGRTPTGQPPLSTATRLTSDTIIPHTLQLKIVGLSFGHFPLAINFTSILVERC